MNAVAHGKLGPIGIWSLELRFGDRGEAVEAAAELDELGYSALWIPGGVGGDVMGDVVRLLQATQRTTIATGILNVWKHEAHDVGAWWQSLTPEYRERTLLGLGISHSHIVGEAYQQPLAAMRGYLNRLHDAGVPADSLCLAALGPKMLELARDRTRGAHPYLVTPEHTAQARAVLGSGKLLAPELGVVMERDPARARTLARQMLKNYLGYPNYVNSWRRLGFADADITNTSDAFVDALFAWGSIEDIAARVKAHRAAGADHVCLQVVTGAGVNLAPARAAWRELAQALL